MLQPKHNTFVVFQAMRMDLRKWEIKDLCRNTTGAGLYVSIYKILCITLAISFIIKIKRKEVKFVIRKSTREKTYVKEKGWKIDDSSNIEGSYSLRITKVRSNIYICEGNLKRSPRDGSVEPNSYPYNVEYSIFNWYLG